MKTHDGISLAIDVEKMDGDGQLLTAETAFSHNRSTRRLKSFEFDIYHQATFLRIMKTLAKRATSG